MNREELFWTKVNKDGPVPERRPDLGPCWIWTAGVTREHRGPGRKGNPYGSFFIGSRAVRAHRYSYELANGPIPDGLVLDHLCKNTVCVNPKHLEPTTNLLNVMRGDTIVAAHSLKTHCPQGHPYDLLHTKFATRKSSGRAYRRCRTCENDSKRRRRREKSIAAQSQEGASHDRA